MTMSMDIKRMLSEFLAPVYCNKVLLKKRTDMTFLPDSKDFEMLAIINNGVASFNAMGVLAQALTDYSLIENNYRRSHIKKVVEIYTEASLEAIEEELEKSKEERVIFFRDIFKESAQKRYELRYGINLYMTMEREFSSYI